MTEAKMVVRGKEVRFLDDEDHRARIDRAGHIPHFPDEAAERAWWGEHTLSEEFWKNAEPVSDDDLPPARAPRPDATGSATLPAGGGFSPSPSFRAGLVVGGVIVAGALWLVYELFVKGKSPAADFLPTGVPHLSISPPRAGEVLRHLPAGFALTHIQ
jgi:hypothetical protein